MCFLILFYLVRLFFSLSCYLFLCLLPFLDFFLRFLFSFINFSLLIASSLLLISFSCRSLYIYFFFHFPSLICLFPIYFLIIEFSSFIHVSVFFFLSFTFCFFFWSLITVVCFIVLVFPLHCPLQVIFIPLPPFFPSLSLLISLIHLPLLSYQLRVFFSRGSRFHQKYHTMSPSVGYASHHEINRDSSKLK